MPLNLLTVEQLTAAFQLGQTAFPELSLRAVDLGYCKLPLINLEGGRFAAGEFTPGPITRSLSGQGQSAPCQPQQSELAGGRPDSGRPVRGRFKQCN